MKRQSYIYTAIPLFVLLSCGSLMQGLFGASGALIAASIVILVTWSVVWMRLFGMRRVRPEFAVLTVLPQAIYFILKAAGSEVTATFAAPAWQNMYFLTWLAAVAVIILSLRPGHRDDTHRPMSQDPVFILTTILTCVYGFSTWAGYAADLFSI